MEEGPNSESVVGMYYYWKDVLKGRASRIKCMSFPVKLLVCLSAYPLYDEEETNKPAGFSRVTSCFFPIRYAPCYGDQLSDDAAYATEVVEDRAILRDFVFSVERKGSLDITNLFFRWLKDILSYKEFVLNGFASLGNNSHDLPVLMHAPSRFLIYSAPQETGGRQVCRRVSAER